MLELDFGTETSDHLVVSIARGIQWNKILHVGYFSVIFDVRLCSLIPFLSPEN